MRRSFPLESGWYVRPGNLFSPLQPPLFEKEGSGEIYCYRVHADFRSVAFRRERSCLVASRLILRLPSAPAIATP
jgi:hypothetical protein